MERYCTLLHCIDNLVLGSTPPMSHPKKFRKEETEVCHDLEISFRVHIVIDILFAAGDSFAN
jgi:hypothetical protein